MGPLLDFRSSGVGRRLVAAKLRKPLHLRGVLKWFLSEPKVFNKGRITMSWSEDGQGREYIDGLFAYAVVLTRNQAEAEDLVQETYVRAIQAMGRLRPESNVKSWMFTILRNLWLNQLRKMRNGPQMIQMEAEEGVANRVVEPSRNSHDLYVSKLEAEQVRAAIQKLPTKFREIILLREYEDLSYQDIARVLNCPVGTVMSRLGRARAMLRIVLVATLRKSASIDAKGSEMKGRNTFYSTNESRQHPTGWAGC